MNFKSYLDKMDDEVEYESLEEGKKIGIIYHFTKKSNIKNMLDPPEEWKAELFGFISMNGVISTTRNFQASDNIINKGSDLDLCTYNIRIALDGDGISNKYKIRPLLGLKNNDSDVFNQDKNDNRVLRSSGEYEEAVHSKKYKTFKLKKYIKQIQIYNCSTKDEILFNDIKELVFKAKLDISIELVRKFKPLKESQDGYFDIIYKEEI